MCCSQIAGASWRTKYSSAPNDLMREAAFCLLPASPVANYLGVDEAGRTSMTVDRMGSFALILKVLPTLIRQTWRAEPQGRAWSGLSIVGRRC